ncbi:hypothetical protein [Candidatus Viridilinea mediisalina]|uniref:hypothetical protein n=1 Tax=Candidatus Viridilinea mediisalina TaxID=2024553 RepID=UPI000F5AF99A|nr:hypothetical protein [Candidatus Viridilinea mediisalina]
MASSTSGRALPRAGGVAWSLPRVGELGPYLFLAILTVVLMLAAYTPRPTVLVDLGNDRDGAFVQGFHGREIEAATTLRSFDWPADATSLTVPGGQRGDLIAVLHVAPDQPFNILREAAVAVNDVRVAMPRRTFDTIVVRITPELAQAETLTFTLVSPLTNDPPPPQHIVGRVELAPARTYRWTAAESSIALPHLGRGAWIADLGVITQHPDGAPLGATVTVGQLPPIALPETGEPRRVRVLIPPSALRDGSLDFTINSKVYTDPRPLGVLMSNVKVAPAVGTSLGTMLPPLSGLVLALVGILGAFATLQVLVGGPVAVRERWPTPSLWALMGISLAALVGAWFLGSYRFPSSFMLLRIASLALGSLLLALVLQRLTRWLFRVMGAPLEQAEDAEQLLDTPKATNLLTGERFLSILLLIVMVSFWLKALGVIYPFFVAVDVNWHMTRAMWILDGKLPLLYGTDSPLNETTMPEAEWGSERPVIPYSPWFHMVATVFAFVPFVDMDRAANLASILLDSSRIILIALIAVRIGLSRRTALLAGATYAVIPVAFLLHAWGNLPTAFGLWFTLVCNTIIICMWDRLHERRVMVTLSVFLLAAFLIYTVTGVFMGVFLVLLTGLVWLNGMRGGAWAELRDPLRPLWIGSGVAIALAILIYYGQYIPPIIEQTVPYMKTVFVQGPESVGVERLPFDQYLWSYVPHLDYRIWPGDYLYYGIAIPVLFTIPGYLALRKHPLAWVAFSAWGTLALLFTYAGYRISMVDKQLFYLLPVICICWAIYAERIWARWTWGRWLVVAVLLYTLYTALDQWLMRIAISEVID